MAKFNAEKYDEIIKTSNIEESIEKYLELKQKLDEMRNEFNLCARKIVEVLFEMEEIKIGESIINLGEYKIIVHRKRSESPADVRILRIEKKE